MLSLTFPRGGALVVGGTGVIGEGIVRTMCAAGVPLVFTYRGGNGRKGEERSQALEAELRGGGHEVERLQLDIGDPGAIRGTLDLVREKWGRVHSVMSATGPVTPYRLIADFAPEEIKDFIDDDLLGYFRLYREAVIAMRESGGGTITGTTTVANVRVLDYLGISSFSKAGVCALTRQIAAEEGAAGIRCNAISIGLAIRQSLDEIVAQAQQATRESGCGMFEDIVQRMAAQSRLNRCARPEEAGNLFAFLASDQASFITGQVIQFDGGVSL